MDLGRFGILFNAEYEHAALLRYARLAEDLGFGTLWYADERFYRETYVGLAACAVVTSRIRLGPGVTDPYTRHPALTAAAIASLDELSGGRAVLGYGAGRSGFDQLGIGLERPVTRLREAIVIIRRLLAGEVVTYEGEVLSLRGGGLKFRARADLPIYLAADGPRTLRLAGAVADAVVVAHCASPRILRGKLADVADGSRRAGRASLPRVAARLDVTVARDADAARRYARLRVARILWSQYPDIRYLANHGLALPPDLARLFEAAGPFPRSHDLSVYEPFVDAIPDDLAAPISIAGDPGEVARRLAAVLQNGADELMPWLFVAPGETLESAMTHYAEAAQEALGILAAEATAPASA